MKLACCDIGNTKIKIGVYDRDTLLSFLSFSSIRETKDYLKKLHPDATAISSVVPKTLSVIDAFFRKELGIRPFLLDNQKKYRLKIEYDTPETLGNDRICTSEGAFKLYTDKKQFKENEILVAADLGTACTINIVEYPDRFTGGLISPGQGLLFKGMKLYTAQLPQAAHSDYAALVGKNTKECIASGIRNSILGLLERVYYKLSSESSIAAFYITGGNAPQFIDDLNFQFEHRSDLLIIGIKSIYDYNN